jgi:ribonuclease H, mammalian HI/archaeal HII subfamily
MGPLVVACVFADDDSVLREMGVKDSKKLSPKKREELYSLITRSFEYTVTMASSDDIDRMRKAESLNSIELKMFARVSGSKAEHIIADCPDVNESSFSNELSAMTGSRVTAQHKADDTFPVVSAASIVAKVTRDRCIEKISKEIGNIGSGYPSDTVTMEFIEKWIKDNGCAPPYTRCSWEPVRKMLSVSANTKITDW